MKLVGVESGGTRTWGAYGDASSPESLDLPRDIGCIAGTRSTEELASTFNSVFERIAAKTVGTEVTVWISAAGYTFSSASRLSELAKSAATATGVRGVVYLANDATTLMLTPPRSGSGVVAIVGTGSVVLAAHDGTARKFSGDEWIASDIGSGFEIGLNGIRAGYAKLQGWRTEVHTGLDKELEDWLGGVIRRTSNPLQLAQQVLDIKDPRAQIPYALRALATYKSDLKALIADFAPTVIRESAKGDEAASLIMDDAAGQMAKLIRLQCQWLGTKLRSPEPDVYRVCMDGFIGGTAPYQERLREMLDRINSSAKKKKKKSGLSIAFDLTGTAFFSARSGGKDVVPSKRSEIPIQRKSPPPSFLMAEIANLEPTQTFSIGPDLGVSRILVG